jgi:colicin import membrane protein
MTRKLLAVLLGLGIVMSAPLGAQNTADTAAAKKQLKGDQKVDKQQSKADKAERKALGTKQQKKADKAQDKANKQAEKTYEPRP